MDCSGTECLATMAEIPGLAPGSTGGKPVRITDYDGRDIALPAGVPHSYIYADGSADGKWLYTIDGSILHKVPNPNYIPAVESGTAAGFISQIRASGRAGKILEKLQSDPDNWSRNAKKTMFFNPIVLNDGLRGFAARTDFPTPNGVAAIGVSDGENIGAVLGFRAVDENWSFGANGYFGGYSTDTEYKYGNAAVWGVGADAGYSFASVGAKYFSADWKDVAIMNESGGMDTLAKSDFFYGYAEVAPTFFDAVRIVIRANYLMDEIAGARNTEIFPTYGGRVFFEDRFMSVAATYGIFVMREFDEIDAGATAAWHFSDDGFSVAARIGIKRMSISIGMDF